jgi:hypothetical protein
MGPPSSGGGISIPTGDAPMSNGAPGDDQAWSSGARSPGRGQGDHPPRRSSRSRSPTARDSDRGLVMSTLQPVMLADEILAAVMAVVATTQATISTSLD